MQINGSKEKEESDGRQENCIVRSFKTFTLYKYYGD
jgi:hypothetical protein